MDFLPLKSFGSIQRIQIRYFTWVSLLLINVTWGQVALQTAFHVDTTATCSGRLPKLQNYWSDSYQLVTAARQAFTNYATDINARKALTTYFGIVPNQAETGPNQASRASYTRVQNSFAQVLGFMQGTVPGGQTPWLFCDSTWLQQKAWTDQAQDQNGVLLTLNGAPVNIQTQYAAMFATAGTRLPFWSSQLNTYLVLNLNDGSGYCAAGNLGGTQDVTLPATISLCPNSFTMNKELGISVESCWSWKPIKGRILQNNGGCEAMTLFHEMFHLVIGTATTLDNGIYGADSCIEMVDSGNSGDAVQAPDCYAWFALAYGYSTRTFTNSAGVSIKWQFSTGRAVTQSEIGVTKM